MPRSLSRNSAVPRSVQWSVEVEVNVATVYKHILSEAFLFRLVWKSHVQISEFKNWTLSWILVMGHEK